MYYYILEQPKNGSTLSIQKKIKNQLAFYGILGEISRVSPARSVEELTEIAIAKQYSTIVAVGSDQLINNIVSYINNRDCTLGIIPINTSNLMNQLIAVNDVKKACEALKERKIKTIDSVYIVPDKFFLTKANISNSKPTLATIYFDKCNVSVRFTEIVIYSPAIIDNNKENKIYLNIKNDAEGPNEIRKIWNWLLGKKIKNNFNSYLRMKHLIIDTPEPIPVKIDGKIVAKTPIEIKVKPKSLKIITSRVKIIPNK